MDNNNSQRNILTENSPSTKISRYPVKPLERMDIIYDEKTIICQIQDMLSINDNEIFDENDNSDYEDQQEDFTSLPQPSNQLNRNNSISSEFSHVDYINSIRKSRPLPKIPDRVSSMNMPQNMTVLLNESFRDQNRLSVQQLFHLLNKQKLSTEDEEEEDDDAVEEKEEYGGVFALKTEIPSPLLANKESFGKYYQDMNKDNKLMMTPVPEVDEEEQLVDKDEQQETDVLAVVEVEEEEEENDENKTPSYVLLPTPENKLCSLSEASLSAPSLTSGRTSPSSSSSHHSFSHDEELYYDQQEDKYDTINNISSFYLADTTPLPTQTKEEEKEKEKEKEEEDVDETDQRYDVQQSSEINRNSLISDVQKLSELNKALMTPQVPHPHLPTIIQQQQQQQQYLTPITSYQPSITSYQMNEYANVNRSSFESITSFSLTNNKDSIKTYRRMASKTMDYNVQYSYAKYLMRLVSFYASNSNNVATIETRIRLQEEAEYWIERLAKMNYAPALYTKGQWHRHCCSSKTAAVFVGSQYKKVSHTKAFKCFQQAAKYGSIEAHYELAEYYMVRKDYKKSITCYQYAASKNHILSLYKLANISMRGLLDQPKNIKQGLIYLRHAADANQPECARSAYDYACILLSDLESIGLDRDPSVFSIYITPDSVAAIYYLKKADKFGLSNATYRLGCMSLAEQSIHSKWEAFKYFSRAAEQKHDGAMIELSKLYKEGISGYLNPHPMLAYEWCLRVAEKGNEMAEYMIGMYYDKGIGIYPDHQKAREWYSKSAAKGYRPAEEILGIQSSSSNNKSTKNQRHYYEESIRLEENSRQVTFAEQNCQIM